ncbi:putative hemolysin-iii channel protein [Botrytis fragariae]|uniref:Putative hemolysin-iii channel protein n=1 Tax=Botrytis fragariae TaxID=1964551 RepID=A0A8H6B3J5_9HELO|nr:putative hemolysin-iii channel protein [Botrytis fragariae]KAF5878518.1 putative hemolysin-iii channel protein [Botrytis fragariae]
MVHRRKSPSPGKEGAFARKWLHDEKSSLLGIPNPFSNRNTPILKPWTELGEFCRNRQHFLHSPPTKLRHENFFEKEAQADVVASVLRRLDRDMATLCILHAIEGSGVCLLLYSYYGFLHEFLEGFDAVFSRLISVVFKEDNHFIETGYRTISNIRLFLMIERHLILFENVLQVGDISTTRLHVVNIWSHLIGAALFVALPVYLYKAEIPPRYAVATKEDIVLSLLAVVCSVSTFQPHFRDPFLRPVRAATFGSLAVVTMVPVVHGATVYGWQVQNQRMGITWVLITLMLNVLGATAYAIKFPERWFNKTFDLVGASHQLFHMMVVLAALVYSKAILQAFDFAHAYDHTCNR